jgi:predicted hydrolase (HD superfamily)
MPRIGDYIVVRDTDFEVKKGVPESFTVELPTNVFRDKDRHKPILAYVVEHIDAKNLEYEIRIYDRLIKSGSLTGDGMYGLWEAFKFRDENNEITIEFKVKDTKESKGTVKFHDVVLWFHRMAKL